MSGQIKSKERVTKYGEVFTAPREVNAMLDLVKTECDRVDSHFLEPACGDGAFLVEILRRKLDAAKKSGCFEYERMSIIAVMSVFGIDIQSDNVETARQRLFDIWLTDFQDWFQYEPTDARMNRIRMILKRNIVCGDFLTGLTSEGEPIWFLKEAFH